MSLSQQQSVVSMRYYLYQRPLHPELFDIYLGDRIVREDFEAQIWVTGCSHVIGFYHQGVSLVEVLADVDGDQPANGRLMDLPIRGEKEHTRLHSGQVKYMMNFQVESMSEKVYATTHHDIARQGAKRGLFVPFPTWMNNPPLTPFSYIDYDVTPKHLHVFAFHAFPDDLTLVKVQSIFELA